MTTIESLLEYHLSTWFLLPAVGCSKAGFDPYGYFNTYTSTTGRKIFVCTAESPEPYLASNTCEIELMLSANGYVAVFTVPDEYRDDVIKYTQGQYSQFSDNLKGQIIRNSGLYFDMNMMTGASEQDYRLGSILKNCRQKTLVELASMLYSEEDIEKGMEVLNSVAELLPPPNTVEFIEFGF